MSLDETNSLKNSGEWLKAVSPTLVDTQNPDNIRRVVSTILKMKNDVNYERHVRHATQTHMPREPFLLVESIFETLTKIDKRDLMHGAASLVNGIAENKDPTADESDDPTIDIIQTAIPEMIEEGFLAAVSMQDENTQPTSTL